MKFYLFIFALFNLITIIKNAKEEQYLKPSDYFLCEYNTTIPKNGKECNSRWTPLGDNDGFYGKTTVNGTEVNVNNTVGGDYRCCYVEYKTGPKKVQGCYLVQDSKTHRSKYKNRILDQFESVKIKCDSNFLNFSAIIFAVVFSLIF